MRPTNCILFLTSFLALCGAAAAQELVQVRQDFTEDPRWEGMNNRVEATDPPTIKQDFGWSPTNRAGGGTGEIGGTVWRSRTIAYYAMPLGKPLTFKEKFSASGKIALMAAEKTGGAYIGFFNHARQEWRPWSSMAFRLGDYTKGAELHLDYMTATWRANGLRLPLIVPADGSSHTWRMTYDPDATIDAKWPDANLEPHLKGGREREEAILERARKTEPDLSPQKLRERLERALDKGLVGTTRLGDHDAWWKNENPTEARGCLTFQLDDAPPQRLWVSKEDRDEPVVLDRFGIFNFQIYGRHWEFYDNESSGTNCEFYVGDLTVNDKKIDLSKDPGWEGVGNRVSFVDRDFHGRHNFGFSETNWAGEKIGEVGGTIWRNETIDPLHAFYADDVGKLTLDDPISFTGTLVFVDGATDGDAYIGFFNTEQRLKEFTGGNRDYPPDLAVQKGGRRNIHLGFDKRAARLPGTMGITVGGPTRVGFYFAAHCTPTEQISRAQNGPAIHPDRKRRKISFDYDPKANGGDGRITAKLDDEQLIIDLTPDMRKAGATFDHFGLSSARVGGKWVTVYLDDLTYTARRPKDYQPVRHEQKITTVSYPEGGRKY